MNLDQGIALRTNGYNRVIASYAIVLALMAANAAIILAFAGGASLAGKVLLAVSALSPCLFAALAIPAIWAELAGLRSQKADGLGGTAYEAAVDGANYPLFNLTAAGGAALYAAVALWAIFG